MFSVNKSAHPSLHVSAPDPASSGVSQSAGSKRKSSPSRDRTMHEPILGTQTPSACISRDDLRADKKGKYGDHQALTPERNFHGAPLSLAPAPFMPITFNPYTQHSPSLNQRQLPW